MEESKKTIAIVLNRQDYREYDSLVSFYSLEYGKIFLIARGVKKPKSKLVGHLEPLNLVDLMIIKGKGKDYVGGVINREIFPSLKSDLNKLYYAGAAVRWFRRLISDNEPDEQIFVLLLNYLELLEDYKPDLSKEDGELFFSFFIFKLLAIMGYKPETEKCIACQNKIHPGNNYFNLQSGGLLCENCFKEGKGGEVRELLTISDNCVKTIRFYLDNDIKLGRKLRIDKKLSKELSILTTGFINFRT